MGDMQATVVQGVKAITSGIRNNNQNTVFMKVHHGNRFHFLHDNRVFIFIDRDVEDGEEGTEGKYLFESQPSTRGKTGDKNTEDNIEQLLLDLLTTSKYRVMQLLYLIFRITDNVMFLSLIISGVYRYILGHGIDQTQQEQEKAVVLVFSVVGVEVFYDVMSWTTKIWIVNRLGFYIGIMLYCCYAIAFAFVPNVDAVVWMLLGIRFGAYLLESFVDYAMDLEMHNDLVKMRDGEPQGGCRWCQLCITCDSCKCLRVEKGTFLHNKDYAGIPSLYVGSICSWTARSAFSTPTSDLPNEPFTQWRFLLWGLACLLLVPLFPVIVVSLIFALPLTLFFLFLNCFCCSPCDLAYLEEVLTAW